MDTPTRGLEQTARATTIAPVTMAPALTPMAAVEVMRITTPIPTVPTITATPTAAPTTMMERVAPLTPHLVERNRSMLRNAKWNRGPGFHGPEEALTGYYICLAITLKVNRLRNREGE